MHLWLAVLLLGYGLIPVEAAVDLTTARCHLKASFTDMVSSECICEPCSLCYFKFLSWECRSLANNSATDVLVPYADDLLGLQQPVLGASDWFLTEKELTRSRGGIPRDDLQVYSEKNAVQLFSATNKFFSSVYNDLESLNDSDWQVFLTSWSLDNVPFRPKTPDWQNSTFQALFGRVMQRHIKVRALVWANILERAQNVAMQHWMNSFHVSGNNQSNTSLGLLLFDNRLPYVTSSHHQKTLVLSHPDHSSIAYLGGIDMTNDRWDTRFHNHTKLRKLRKIAHKYDGWVDSSLRIEGPAALDVAANFVGRWNAQQQPLVPDEEIIAFDNPPRSSAEAQVSVSSSQDNETITTLPSSLSLGTASIQIVRTFSCKVGYDFAARGEVSLLHARLKAISRAQNYIYIEDQYFINVPELQTALLRQLPLLRALVIVTQKPSLGTSAVGYGKLLYEMLVPLQTQFPGKVHVFTMKPSLDLYIHTKAVLIDDVFVSIGSGNWNQRSMTSDSEIAANIVDTEVVSETPEGITVNALARAFRLAKFSEFSGLSVDELSDMTFFEGIHALELAAISANSVISKLRVGFEPYFDVFPSELEDVIDPHDVCDAL